jgi:integrase
LIPKDSYFYLFFWSKWGTIGAQKRERRNLVPLTEGKIRSLKALEERYKIFDSFGLYLEILPSGTKAWRLKYSLDGKTSNLTLGRWPEISLMKARELALNYKNNLKSGKNPEDIKREELTFKELSNEWVEKFLPHYSEKEKKLKTSFLDRFINPNLGYLKLSNISPKVILDNVLRPIEARGHFETLAKVKTLVSFICRYGVACGLLERDFTLDLTGAFSAPPVVHFPTIIEPERIGKLLSDIRSYEGSPSVKYALRILPYIFVRPGELRYALWKEINFDTAVWRIPAEKMKMKAPHIVPLSTQVLDLMKELQKYTGEGEYLFPGQRVKTRPISDAAINAALRYLGYAQGVMCGHGFRAMASTLLNEQGYPPDWIERQLAHSERNGVRAAYNHAQYLKERRKMLQDWADYLDSLIPN